MIDERQIQYLEKLARIQLTEDQRVTFSHEIGRILEYMERLSAVDLDELAHGDRLPETGGGREDEPRESLPREALLAASPDATPEYMTVPRAVQ